MAANPERIRLRFLVLVGGFILSGLILGAGVASWTSAQSSTPSTRAIAASSSQSPSLPRPPPRAASSLPFAGPSSQSIMSLPQPSAAPTSLDPLAAASALLRPSPHGANRLIIPSLGIDSAWLPLGFLPNGVTMDSPPGPQDLGWYTFTGQPGGPSNAVFAGHVDWHTGAPAIFGHLSSLKPGSEIDISRADGSVAAYHVVSSLWYTFPTDATTIIAPTAAPTVTLITCGGTFNQVTREYDQRLVVRAVAAGL